jgi:outer membrane lipoprotein-sorting protein
MKSLFKKVLLFSLAANLYTAGHPALAALVQDQDQVQKIQSYLDGIRTLQANFSQTTSNGKPSSGRLYLDRSGSGSFGKLRLDYAAPNNTKIIADGETLHHIDGQTGESSDISIDQTPASFLLRRPIDFSGDLKVKNMKTMGNTIELALQRSGDEGTTLTLIIGISPENPNSTMPTLKAWRILDNQGNKTNVTLNNVQIGMGLDAGLFVYKG